MYIDTVVVRGPRDYVELPEIPPDWKVLDIGPGRYPLPRADMYLDHDVAGLDAAEIHPSQRIIGDLERGLREIPDKAFDYIWCSHALEHVSNLAQCAAEISRIGKSGTVVLPSAIKEAIFNFEEADHKWLVLPSPIAGEAPIFVRHNEAWIAKLKNIEIQRINCRIYRTGTYRQDHEDLFCQKWFLETERHLDIVHHWTDEFRPTVIG